MVFIPGLMPTLLSREAYIPRATSAVTLVGLSTIIVGLIGSGLVLAPIVSSMTLVMWVFIFFRRGKRRRPAWAKAMAERPEVAIPLVLSPEATRLGESLSKGEPVGDVKVAPTSQ